jgi:3-oxoacyl-[acyl-carrier protein] reductase
MELGIEGRLALVCGASKGLGFACALALAHEGVRATLVARDQTALTSAADRIQSTTGQPCHSIAAASQRLTVAAACSRSVPIPISS